VATNGLGFGFRVHRHKLGMRTPSVETTEGVWIFWSTRQDSHAGFVRDALENLAVLRDGLLPRRLLSPYSARLSSRAKLGREPGWT